MKIKLKFEPRDLWVGVFWDVRPTLVSVTLHVFVCVVPCFPIHIVFDDEPTPPNNLNPEVDSYE